MKKPEEAMLDSLEEWIRAACKDNEYEVCEGANYISQAFCEVLLEIKIGEPKKVAERLNMIADIVAEEEKVKPHEFFPNEEEIRGTAKELSQRYL